MSLFVYKNERGDIKTAFNISAYKDNQTLITCAGFGDKTIKNTGSSFDIVHVPPKALEQLIGAILLAKGQSKILDLSMSGQGKMHQAYLHNRQGFKAFLRDHT